MILNEEIMRLICDMERIISDHCYNSHSTNGYTRQIGRSIRYPVWAKIKYGDIEVMDKTNYWLHNILPENIESIHYKFGANHLYIGNALNDVLGFLEERYDIDFNKLEDDYQKKLIIKEDK